MVDALSCLLLCPFVGFGKYASFGRHRFFSFHTTVFHVPVLFSPTRLWNYNLPHIDLNSCFCGIWKNGISKVGENLVIAVDLCLFGFVSFAIDTFRWHQKWHGVPFLFYGLGVPGQLYRDHKKAKVQRNIDHSMYSPSHTQFCDKAVSIMYLCKNNKMFTATAISVFEESIKSTIFWMM